MQWLSAVPDAETARPGQRPSLLDLLIPFLGAFSGVLFVVYSVGGIVISRRLKTLGLPDESTVADLPRGNLAVAGLLELGTPLLIGLAAIVLLLVARRFGVPRLAGSDHRTLVLGMYIAFVLGAAAVAYLASSWADGVLVASAGLLPLAAASLDRVRDDVLAYAVLFAIVTVGTIVKYVNVWLPPSHLERVSLVFANGGSRDGYLVMTTSSSVYVAGRADACRVSGQISVFRRDDIVEMRVRRRVDVWPAKHRLTAHERQTCADGPAPEN